MLWAKLHTRCLVTWTVFMFNQENFTPDRKNLHRNHRRWQMRYAHQSHLMCRLLSEKKLYCHCIVTSALLRYHVLGVCGPCLYRDWLFWPSGQLDLFLCVTISTDPCDCVSVLLNKTDWCCSIKICVTSSRRDEKWQFLQLDENCILTRATTIMISINFSI